MNTTTTVKSFAVPCPVLPCPALCHTTIPKDRPHTDKEDLTEYSHGMRYCNPLNQP